MTHHQVRVTNHFARLVDAGVKTAELRYDDRDFQTGDTIAFCDDSTGFCIAWMRQRTITHVLKNYSGLQAGFVVLSLNDPDLDHYREQARMLSNEVSALKRSNASLRGQITKLRTRLGAKSLIPGIGEVPR